VECSYPEENDSRTPAFVRRGTSGGERIGARNFHNFSRGDNNRVLLEPHLLAKRSSAQTAKWFEPADLTPSFSLLPSSSLRLLSSRFHAVRRILQLLCVFRCNHFSRRVAPLNGHCLLFLRLREIWRANLIWVFTRLSSFRVYVVWRSRIFPSVCFKIFLVLIGRLVEVS